MNPLTCTKNETMMMNVAQPAQRKPLMNTKNPHVGGDFDSFLEESHLLDACEAAATETELARRMHSMGGEGATRPLT